MYTHFNFSMGREVTTILPGEYYASRDDAVICTVLGSCIAVALFDPAVKTGGLNHFMLPGRKVINSSQFFFTAAGRYGIHAMELLINDLVKLGSKRERLVAKIFGGGSVLPSIGERAGNIADSNISFACQYLETEGIRIAASDVGGTKARKIYVFSGTGKILLKRLGSTKAVTIEAREIGYGRKIRKALEKDIPGRIVFFDEDDNGEE